MRDRSLESTGTATTLEEKVFLFPLFFITGRFHYYDAGEDWRDATGAGRSSLALVFLVPHNCQGYIVLAHLLVVSNKLTPGMSLEFYTYIQEVKGRES